MEGVEMDTLFNEAGEGEVELVFGALSHLVQP